MPAVSLLRAALAMIAIALAGPALAQPLGIQSSLLQDRRDRPEGGIRFCVNPDSLLAGLDRAIGAALGEALLLEVEFTDLETDYAVPLDHVLAVDEQNLYIQLYTGCDAVLGFAYPPAQIQPWLTVTRPVYRTRDVALASAPEIESLGDLPAGARIGTRLGSRGDGAVLRYLLSLAPEDRWQRLPYNSNILLLERLADGTVPAAMVWEPAVEAARAEGVIENESVRRVPTAPVPEPTLDFGIVVLAENSFVRTLLDEAIGALAANGTLGELAQDQSIPVLAP